VKKKGLTNMRNYDIISEMGENRKMDTVSSRSTKILQERRMLREGGGKTLISILGIVISMPLGGFPYLFYRRLKAAFNEADRRCGTYSVNNIARQACKLKVRIQAMDKLIELSRKMNKPKLEEKANIKKAKYQKELDKLELILAKRGKIAREPGKPTTDQ